MSEPGQKMSLLEAFAELKPPQQLCSLGKIMDTLDESDRYVLSGWLEDETMNSHRVTRLLNHAGYVVHRNTVADHRKGVCRCGR